MGRKTAVKCLKNAVLEESAYSAARLLAGLEVSVQTVSVS